MLEQLLDPQNGGAGDCLAELVRRAKVAGELADKVQNYFRGNTMSGVYSDGEAGEREMDLVRVAGKISELKRFAFDGAEVEHNTDFPPPRRTRSPDEVLARAVVRARKVIADTPRETLASAAASLWNANRGGAHNFRENDRMHGIEIGDRGGIFITAIKNGWVDTPDGGRRSGKGDGAPFRVQNRYHQGEWMDCSFAYSAKAAFLFQLSEQRRLPNKPLLKILRALNSLRTAEEARWPCPRFRWRENAPLPMCAPCVEAGKINSEADFSGKMP